MNSRTPKLNFERIALWLIILVAAILRFYNLGEMSLSNDELSSLVRVRYDSFSEMISKGVYIDFHPAGLQSFLYFWVKLFGDSAFAIRFPFVIFSLISTGMIYLIGKRWYNGLTGLLAAAAFSFLTFPMLFLELARMYSPGVMFGLLTVYFWTAFISGERIRRKNISWWGWIISMSASLHLHYFSFVFVGLVGITGLFLVAKKDLKKYIVGGIISLLTFIPEIPIFLAQMKTGDIGGWLGPPSKSFLQNFFFELFNRSYLVCTVVGLFFLVSFVFARRQRDKNKWRWISLIWFFASFLIAYVYSIMGHPIIMYSTMLFSTPCLLLFIFSFIPDILLTSKNSIITVAVFSLIIIYDTVIPGKHFSIKYFGVFREVAQDAEGWTRKYGRENVAFAINVVDPEYLNYYFRRMENPPQVVAYRIDSVNAFNRLYQVVDSSKTPYFSFIWTNSYHPWEVLGIIKRSYPYLVDKRNYFNAASYLFSRKTIDTMNDVSLFSSVCDFERNFWSIDSSRTSGEKYFSGIHSQKMDIDFGAAFKSKISEIPEAGYRYITLSAMICSLEGTEDAQLVISFDRNGKPFEYRSSLLRDFNLNANRWQPVILSAEIPKEILADDMISAYIWNPSKKIFFVDDLKVEVCSGVDPYQRFTR